MSAYIDLLKATRAEIVQLLKRQGSMSVEALSAELAISKVAVRRHLDQLEEQGFVGHCSERCERGRPRFLYSLTSDGDGLFPDSTGTFACDLLAQINRTFGDEAVDNLLSAQAETVIETLKSRVEGLSFEDRVRAVAREFNERGYFTDVEPLDDGSFLVVEHNCPIREVAERFPRVCAEELRIYGEVTGGSIALGGCRIVNGASSCEYRVVPTTSGARQLPVMNQTAADQASEAIPAADTRRQFARKHEMTVCVNVHCAMNGAEELVEHLVLAHGVAPDTEVDNGLKLELTYCFGMCDSGPNVEIDNEFYEGVTPEQIDGLIARLD
ncbi:MAG TPA: NAD(P)H-dependent oxidoreductase subunit E [Blastocatellia bacterium]|nr:NAD(P)H-dependent oxidoreductase subunit E [Blastocatellia bacterium]